MTNRRSGRRRAVVDRVDGFELVAEVESGRTPSPPATSSTDLVLMDINLGASTASRPAGSRPTGHQVILVSTYGSRICPRGRTSGAMAYVNKDELSPRMVRRLWSRAATGLGLTAPRRHTGRIRSPSSHRRVQSSR
jgi:hypothetical protein